MPGEKESPLLFGKTSIKQLLFTEQYVRSMIIFDWRNQILF
jgi:hypothetical protein